MKKYIIYTLKRYIPLYAVTFAICFSTFLMFFSYTPVTVTLYDNYNYYSINSYFASSGLLIIAIMFSILTMILPLFANTYRNSIKGADIFYQVGKGKRSIRFVNNLTLLTSVIISFTVAFLFGIGVLILRQIPNIGKAPETIQQYGETATKYYLVYNFIYYIPAYLMILISGIINYFISYFFVTRANNVLNSIIVLVLGELILGIGIMTPFWYYSIIAMYSDNGMTVPYATDFLPATQTASIIGPVAFINMLFEGPITGMGSGIVDYLPETMDSKDVLSLVLTIVGLVGFLAMGALGIYRFIKEPESSGELCGKPQGRGIMQIIIFHIGFGFIGLWSNSFSSLTSSLLLGTAIIMIFAQGTIYSAIYFVFTGLIRRNFKLNLKEVIILISSAITNISLGIVLASFYISHFQ